MPSPKLSVLLAVAVVAVVSGTGLPQDKAPPTSPEKKLTIEQLIERLDSEDYETRESVTRELMERDEALPALQKALQSSSLEVRNRAKRIIEKIADRPAKKRVQQLVARMKRGGIDLFVDQLAATQNKIDDATCQAVLELLGEAVATANKKHKKNLIVPDVNRDRGWRWLGVTYDPDTDPQMLGRPIQVDQRLLVPQITKIKFNNRPPLLTRCLVLCPGQVQSLDMKESIIFANGSIQGDPRSGGFSVMNCILICDGDIELRNVFNCLVIASGTVKIESIYGDDVLSVQKAQEAFGVIKFYDPKQAGIEVGEAQEGVAVKKVLEGKPFAKAGFKEGDAIIAINGTKVRNAEEFRRLVRRQTACSKEMVFKVGRGERTLELTVVPTDP